MIIWSIHDLAFYQKLEKNKVIFPNKKKLNWKDDFLDSYLWLSEQMDKRIGGRPHPTAVPFWGWYQFRDAQHKKPDLRVRCHLEAGTKGVRLELEIPDNEAVLTDFDIWCDILNKNYIPDSHDDYSEFYRVIDKRKLYGFNNWSKWHQRKAEKSWQKVFDLSYWVKDFSKPKNKKAIQATFWKISMDQVKDVKFFTARKPAF